VSDRRLPPSFEMASVRNCFAPSRFSELARCPLRVFVDADDVRDSPPPPPTMLLGLVLHHVREQLLIGRWGGALSSIEAFEEVFGATVDAMDAQLVADTRFSRLAPLASAVGRVRWNTRRFEMRKWAARLQTTSIGEAPRRLEWSPPLGGSDAAQVQSEEEPLPRLDFGPQAWIVCPALRIRGRVDLVEEAADGAVEISDYKTGVLCDDGGRPLKRHVLPLGIYALAAEFLAPERPVRLYLDGADRLAVKWDPDTRRFCSDELSKAADRFPAGASHGARELAQPGRWCIGCRIRPVCPSYLDAAPKWRPNTDDAPRPLPIDVWGKVLAIRRDEGGVTVEMEDQARRCVRVEGLDPSRDLGGLRVGDVLYLFDLEPTEPTVLHGARLHPRNFHELPPDDGPRFKRARALQVFQA